MTTIAYRDGVLAADTQLTDCDELANSSAVKIGLVGSILFGASGESSYMQLFLAWAGHGFVGNPPTSPRADGKASGFAIRGDELLEWFPCGRFSRSRTRLFADGSGRKLAYGAMEAGASAEHAVEIAARYDIYTGGEITVLRR